MATTSPCPAWPTLDLGGLNCVDTAEDIELARTTIGSHGVKLGQHGQRSLLIRSQLVSVVTMFHALKIMPSFSHFPFDLTKIFDFLSIAISPQFLVTFSPFMQNRQHQ